jgi:tRNA threonylcarbamoyladenosine biosynthesis protein TsaB
MNVLAITQHEAVLQACVWSPSQYQLASRTALKAQPEDLLSLVDELLANQAMAINLVVCEAGPGPFTSLRLQASLAQSLAYGWNVPITMVDSLVATVYTAKANGTTVSSSVLSVADAKLGEWYWQLVEPTADFLPVPPTGQPLPLGVHQAHLGSAAALKAFFCSLSSPVSILVPTTHEVPEPLCDLGFIAVDSITLRATVLAQMGCLLWQAGLAQSPLNAQLNYVRNKVALTTQEQQALKMAQ